ncbi:MAG: polysaccharide biosynthesis tyrosine autokinase [Planctomycetes bacterium]|nr:polysaccharide biosynthesis tyrosine autokinase [Planctomycetota bacterium]
MSAPFDKTSSDTAARVANPTGFQDDRGVDALVAGRAALDVVGHTGAVRPSRPSILYATPKPLDLLRALQRRWLLALAVGLALAVPAGVITWFSVPDVYETYAILRVRHGGLLNDLKGEMLTLAAQRELIKHPMVINAALAMPGVNDLPCIKSRISSQSEVDWVASQIIVRSSGVSPGSTTETMQIGMAGDDPMQMKVLVNAVTKAFLTRVTDEERRGLIERREKLDKAYLTKTEEVRRKRDHVYDLAQRVGTSNPQTAQTKQQLLVDYVMQLRKEITQQRSLVFRKKQDLAGFIKVNGLGGAAGGPLPESLLQQALEGDPDCRIKEEQIKKMESALAELMKVVKDPNSPAVRAARESLEKVRTSVDERKLTIQKQLEKDWKEGRIVPKNKAEAEVLTNELAQADATLTEMESQYKSLSKDIEDLGNSTSDLDRSKEELATVVGITNQLGLALEKYDLELGGGDRITMYAEADIPRVPQSNRRAKYTWLLALVSLGMGLGLVSLWEFHARRITSATEVDEGLGMRVIGDVPMLSHAGRHWWSGNANGASTSALQGIMDESVDGIRAMLLHSVGGDAKRVVLITSAKAGEGKTTISVSLAASLGRCGRRTLLIDGDLRRPNVHRLLDMPLNKGLADVLRGEATVQEVIHPSRATGMWVMSAGHCDHTSLQSLTKNILGQLFESLRSEFDSIIVDSGPVLAVVDPLLLGQHCDGAIISIVHRVSQITPVYEACERLKSTGIKVLGCVVNGTSHRSFGLGHGYYGYGYGYGYGYSHNSAHTNGQTDQPTPPPAGVS